VNKVFPEKKSATLELKEKLTDGFLKTVSAFANYGDGRIVFGPIYGKTEY